LSKLAKIRYLHSNAVTFYYLH